MTELMHFAATVPSVPAQRRMNLGAVAAAREGCAGRPPWPAIFAKAYATVAQEFPELRRVYLKYPRAHLYEYPTSVAVIATERDCGGELGVFGCVIKNPAALPLAEIGHRIDYIAQTPMSEVRDFRRIMAIGRLPQPFRRMLMWIGFHVGRQRANYFGTFAISAVASLGTDLVHPLSAWTTLLTYGTLGIDGAIDVRIIFDHRVVDGATIGRVLARLEEVLTGAIVEELGRPSP